ncbi:unnamed protein product [Ceutorhynchus assimilis]|uniref:Nudix hydrolase domain-containing protein n=1 Tax=Ceutorhynchus assimilis TaxID=467358 RepID=A0A9N9MMB2_9CUCU|nr:unnamed protein product [Ceutorhynchus assimilis]
MMFKSRVALIKSVGSRCTSLYAPEVVLSEENVKKTMAKFSSLKPIRMIARKPTKRAGVLIPVCVSEGKVALLYTLRAANLKTHRGQVSFPGGMQDVADKNLEQTALRETEEELGIKKSDIEIWGSGSLIVTRLEICVTPVIAQIRHLKELRVNPSEVDQVFTVALEDLCNPQNIGYTQFRGAFASMPVFTGGKFRIWGLTALLTHRFLSSLLPHQAYIHGIKHLTPVTDNASDKLTFRS